jgi:hypothetical protein
MEKTKEFIQTYLQPILDLENDRMVPNILWRESEFIHWEKILREPGIQNILEIGFGAGFSTVFMLISNPDVKITCIDECFHRYSYACYEKIKEIFGENRIRFFVGNSNKILPNLHLLSTSDFMTEMQPDIKGIYDLIHYDGSDALEITEKDIMNTFPLLKENTYFIFSKYHLSELWKKYSNQFQLEKIDGIHSPFFLKRNLNKFNKNLDKIPKKIHRFWHTDMSDKMQKYSDRLQLENADFEYIIYNTESASEFIREHFDGIVLHAFDSLVPFAFKADLFRYCVMYIHGGIYLDMKYESVNGFRFSDIIDREMYVLDIGGENVYNALLICKPLSKVMFKCIFQIVKHVRDKDYTDCDLSITGPGMIRYMVPTEMKMESNLKHECINYNKYILRNEIPILKNYHRYYEDTPKCGQKKYCDYWRNREIYLDIDLSSYQT